MSTEHPSEDTADAERVLALREDGALAAVPLTDAAALRQSLTAYSDARAVLLTWLERNLVAGTDYLLIHRKSGGRECPQKDDRTAKVCARCKAKATLAKPGAEKLCGLLRLRPVFRRDLDTWQMLGGKEGLVALVCELLSTTGEIVAEGRGCRDTGQDYSDANKTIKMAQKSSQIDAVLRCAGLSEVFTQDLEDMMPGAATAPSAVGTPVATDDTPASSAPPLALTSEDESELPLAREEIIALTEAVRASGKTDQRFKNYVRTKYGVQTRADIPRRFYNELMHWAREGV